MRKTTMLCENYMFRRLYRRGKSIASSCMVLYYYKGKRRQNNRLGITVSKKIGGAVQRNRARRVILEAYRLLEPRLPEGYDFVIVARSRAVAVKMQVVMRELSGLMEKL